MIKVRVVVSVDVAGTAESLLTYSRDAFIGIEDGPRLTIRSVVEEILPALAEIVPVYQRNVTISIRLDGAHK